MKYIILHFYLRGESYFAFSTTYIFLEGLVHVQGDTAKLDTCNAGGSVRSSLNLK